MQEKVFMLNNYSNYNVKYHLTVRNFQFQNKGYLSFFQYSKKDKDTKAILKNCLFQKSTIRIPK